MLLSGGSRGIGRAIAQEALKRGWAVSLGLRDPGAWDGAGLDADNQDTLALPYDAAAANEKAWVAETLNRWGRIDAIVCSAGVLAQQPVVTEDDEAVHMLMEVNLHAPRRLASAAWEALCASGRGRVMIAASLSGKRVKSKGSGLYSVSKFAAIGLAHALRHEGWDHGIRATALCPGLVATDMGVTAGGGRIAPQAMTQPGDLARLALAAIEAPNTLSQAEIHVNCQLDESY